MRKKNNKKRRSLGKKYCIGALMTLLGGSGYAEAITYGRGSYMLSVIIFAIGFALVLDSYVWEK